MNIAIIPRLMVYIFPLDSFAIILRAGPDVEVSSQRWEKLLKNLLRPGHRLQDLPDRRQGEQCQKLSMAADFPMRYRLINLNKLQAEWLPRCWPCHVCFVLWSQSSCARGSADSARFHNRSSLLACCAEGLTIIVVALSCLSCKRDRMQTRDRLCYFLLGGRE